MLKKDKYLNIILLVFLIENLSRLYSMESLNQSNKFVYFMILIYRILAVLFIIRVFYNNNIRK